MSNPRKCNRFEGHMTLACLFVLLELASSLSSLSFLGARTSSLLPRHSLQATHSRFRGVSVEDEKTESSFDPLNLESYDSLTSIKLSRTAVTATTALTPLVLSANAAVAEQSSVISSGDFNPQNFQPVCPASDGFYRFLQGATEAVVGPEKFVEYGPLIAGGLLRIRLELCVVESFFNEAVGPFIRENGISWILPLHETVETFLAGTIFSLATTFILVGSTKLLSVIVTYGDVFVGAPCRLFGGFAFDRALGKPVTLDIGFGPFKQRVVGPPEDAGEDVSTDSDKFIDFEKTDPAGLLVILASGSVKTVGEASRFLREFIEGADLFVGRYLVLLATGYIGFKFLHFKLFPDFPPF